MDSAFLPNSFSARTHRTTSPGSPQPGQQPTLSFLSVFTNRPQESTWPSQKRQGPVGERLEFGSPTAVTFRLGWFQEHPSPNWVIILLSLVSLWSCFGLLPCQAAEMRDSETWPAVACSVGHSSLNLVCVKSSIDLVWSKHCTMVTPFGTGQALPSLYSHRSEQGACLTDTHTFVHMPSVHTMSPLEGSFTGNNTETINIWAEQGMTCISDQSE